MGSKYQSIRRELYRKNPYCQKEAEEKMLKETVETKSTKLYQK